MSPITLDDLDELKRRIVETIRVAARGNIRDLQVVVAQIDEGTIAVTLSGKASSYLQVQHAQRPVCALLICMVGNSYKLENNIVVV